jgi:hypothetical protein
VYFITDKTQPNESDDSNHIVTEQLPGEAKHLRNNANLQKCDYFRRHEKAFGIFNINSQ